MTQARAASEAFASPSAGEDEDAGDDVQGHGGFGAENSGNGDQERSSARPLRTPLKPGVPPRMVSQMQTMVMPRERHSQGRRKWLAILMVLMLICMAAAAIYVWKFMSPKVAVNGTLRFEHFADVSPEKQQLVMQREMKLLGDEAVLARAKTILGEQFGVTAGGFLSDPVALKRVKGELRPDASGHGATMFVRYAGQGNGDETSRMQALLQAMYESGVSQEFRDERRQNIEKHQALRDQVISQEAYVRQLKIDVDKLTAKGDTAPERSEVAAASAAANAAQQKWAAATALVSNLTAELARLRQAGSQSPGKATGGADYHGHRTCEHAGRAWKAG